MEMAGKNRRTDRGYSDPAWSRLVRGTVITLVFAAITVWSARAFGRTVTFAFSINWLLAAWAILLGRALQSRSGAWDGLALQLPARYYATRPFEKGGRIYDYLGTGWYKRLLRRVLWTVNPTQLRSRPDARQTMIAGTRAAEAGHLRRDHRLHVAGTVRRLVGHRGLAVAVQSAAQRLSRALDAAAARAVDADSGPSSAR